MEENIYKEALKIINEKTYVAVKKTNPEFLKKNEKPIYEIEYADLDDYICYEKNITKEEYEILDQALKGLEEE